MIEINELTEFLNWLTEHYQIDLIDNSGRRNRYPAEDGERLEKLLKIYLSTLQ
jgi:hypothetical protein